MSDLPELNFKDLPRGRPRTTADESSAPRALRMDPNTLCAAPEWQHGQDKPFLGHTEDGTLIGIKDNRHLITVAGSRAGFNPLADINPDDENFVDDCDSIADALVVAASGETDNHWNNSARLVLRGFVAWVASEPNGKKDLTEVRRLLHMRPDAFDNLLTRCKIRKPAPAVFRHGRSNRLSLPACGAATSAQPTFPPVHQ